MEEIRYVWKRLGDGGEDWYLVTRGEKDIEKNFVLCLSRLNKYFPWSVYDQKGERKDISNDVLNHVEDEKVTSYKDYILSNINRYLKKNESTITEAPDDDGIMSDDELDALDKQERDEFEARLKARRDKVAQDRLARDDRIAKEQQLKAKADELLKEIGNDYQFEHLFDVLVPASGKCDTLAGELVRAINKLEYRWFNDGDRFFEDYGIETCGPAAMFLNNVELEGEDEDELPFYDLIYNCAEDDKDDDNYDGFIEQLKETAIDLIQRHSELLAMETKDMYDTDWRKWRDYLDENNLIPTYDYDSSIPPELQAHLDKGNIDERDLIWEVQSWIENMGNSTDDVRIDWGNVYIYGLNKADYDELNGKLYDWLEDYAKQLDDEYGVPDEREEESEEDEEENEDE